MAETSQENLEKKLSEAEERIQQLETELGKYIKRDEIISNAALALNQPNNYAKNIDLEELLDIDDLRHLQDQFAKATGVASIITNTDGTPITEPSNFSRLCIDIIRNTEKGLLNCYKSDALIGDFNPSGPTIKKCISGGLWDAGAAISVGGNHIANWLIGQVRNEAQSELEMRNYAREISADEEDFMKAFYEVPSMSLKRFEKISKFLYTLANQISNIAYQNVQQDITINQLINAEIEKNRSNREFEQLIAILPQTIWKANLKGGFTYINRIGYDIFGYTSKDVKNGLTIFDVIIPEDRERAYKNFATTMAGSKNVNHEYTCIKKNGTILPVLIYASPIIENGKPIEIIGITVDNSLQKEAEEKRIALEERLQRSQKMESLGLLAGGVAHDLNNVFSGVVSLPELILKTLKDTEENKQLRSLIDIIYKSGKRAATIVDELLTIARRNIPTQEIINLNDFINEYIISPEYNITFSFHSKVTVKTNLETELLNIKGSSIHISKTIMNLVNNAAEAQPDGGEIIISTRNKTIDRLMHGYDNIPEGDYVLLRVSDKGIGIPEEDLKKIFEPFYTKKIMGRSGTGLGMAIVWGAVKDHKGHIDIKSRINEGTTFDIYLPATRDNITSNMDKPLPYYNGNGESILIVDDITEQRYIASLILEQLGYKTHSVSSGEEAIDYLRGSKADLVVLDMIMDPGMNGYETYKKIIEIIPKQKAIIASGFSETELVKKAQELGAGQYIRKPYTIEKIGLAIMEELKKENK